MSQRPSIRCFSPYLYPARNLVERFFNNIKHCRRVATRYDKLAALSLNINLSKWPIYKEVAPNSLNREQGISRPEQGNMQYQAATALYSRNMRMIWSRNGRTT